MEGKERRDPKCRERAKQREAQAGRRASECPRIELNAYYREGGGQGGVLMH